MGERGGCGGWCEMEMECGCGEEKGVVGGGEVVKKDEGEVMEMWKVVLME